MKPMNEIRQTKAENESTLLKKKGVTGIDIGPKITAGQKTEEVAIRVYVEAKKDVAAKDAIPKTLNGVKTDVIERKFVLHQRKMALTDLQPMADTGRYDPLVGGISIGPCRAINNFVFVGTLGAIVTDNDSGARMLLSNHHVLAVDPSFNVGDTMAQPSRVDGGQCNADVVGSLQRTVLDGGSPGNPGVDCAVASHTARTTECRITEIGNVNGTAQAVAGQAVRKRGRTTGLTHGKVDSIDLTVNVPYDGVGVVTLFNQIGIEVDTSKSTEFGKGGDSGSVVVESNNKIIGLYFAGTEDGTFGVANPIDAVLQALNVSVCVPKQKEMYEKSKEVIRETLKTILSDLPEKRFFKDFKEKDFKEINEKLKDFKEFKDNYEGPIFGQPPFDRPFDRPIFGGFGGVAPSTGNCVDFRTESIGAVPNPLAVGGFSFQAFDHAGALWPGFGVKQFGAHTGLDVGFRMEINLRSPCPSVSATLVHFSSPAAMESFNSDGSSAGTAVMSGPQNAAETLTISGSAITRVVITARQDETLLLQFCCGAKDKLEGKENPKIEKLEKLEKPEKVEKIEKPEKVEKPEFKEKEKERKEFMPKELKEFQPKELKEKDKERKEFLPKESKELKDKDKEHKEIKEKDFKEIKEKELKEKDKELKEKDKDFKEFKEKDKDKDVFEKIADHDPKGVVENNQPPFNPGDPLSRRLAQLEAVVSELAHFIERQHRPDLSGGALRNEPGLQAELEKQAADAKQQKDLKDAEKLREG